MPTVSAIVPTYDDAESLPRAIDSVLAQTIDDVEVVVVDDASTDDTQSVLEAYADEDRVRAFRHDENQGGNAARNTGLERARGEYVGLLDADDEWHPEKCQRQLEVLADADDDCVAAYCDWEYDLDGRTSRVEAAASAVLSRFESTDGPTEGDREALAPEILADDLHTAAGSTLLVERETAVAVGGFDEAFDRFQDTEFLLRVVVAGALVHVEDPLMTRYDTGSPSAETYERANDRLLEKHAAAVARVESTGVDVRGQRELFVAKHYLAEGRYLEGANHLRNAVVERHEIPGLLATAVGGLRARERVGLGVAAVTAAAAVAVLAAVADADPAPSRTDASRDGPHQDDASASDEDRHEEDATASDEEQREEDATASDEEQREEAVDASDEEQREEDVDAGDGGHHEADAGA